MATQNETCPLVFDNEEAILREAKAIYGRRMKSRDALESPTAAIEYLRASLTDRDREIFSVLFLNTRHHVIAYEELFMGTIDGAVVHPREVVRSALLHNASALIIAHNHPSGVSSPSQADIGLTHRLRDALELVDIRLLDHVIIGADEYQSLSRLGHM